MRTDVAQPLTLNNTLLVFHVVKYFCFFMSDCNFQIATSYCNLQKNVTVTFCLLAVLILWLEEISTKPPLLSQRPQLPLYIRCYRPKHVSGFLLVLFQPVFYMWVSPRLDTVLQVQDGRSWIKNSCFLPTTLLYTLM